MTNLTPVVILVGLAFLLVALAVFIATGVQSVLFVGAGVVLVALGAIRGMDAALGQSPEGDQ